ncbi:MAG: metal-dependent hydrolase [Bacillota bacterium]|nr:metal-dependent hydrolase [Bacillota bacterium]
MTGKTHISVGLATAAILLPHSKNHVEFGVSLGFSAIGALMPDVDQKQSILGHIINVFLISILTLLVIIKGIGFLPEYKTFFKNNYIFHWIFETLTKNILPYSNLFTFIGIVIIFISIIIARKTGHRHFAHSILGLASFSLAIYLIFGKALLIPFIVGFVSHMAIDLLNYKGEKIFYPFKLGVCFNLAKSGGKLDYSIATAASIIFVIMSVV